MAAMSESDKKEVPNSNTLEPSPTLQKNQKQDQNFEYHQQESVKNPMNPQVFSQKNRKIEPLSTLSPNPQTQNVDIKAESERMDIVQKLLRNTYVKDVKKCLDVYSCNESAIQQIQSQIQMVEFDIKSLRETNLDLKEQTTEKINDKKTKKRLSVENFDDHNENCLVQLKSIQNQKQVIASIIGASISKNNANEDQNESFQNESFEVVDISEEDASSIKLQWKNDKSYLEVKITEITTSLVQRLKRCSYDEAYMQSHPQENYESDSHQESISPLEKSFGVPDKAEGIAFNRGVFSEYIERDSVQNINFPQKSFQVQIMNLSVPSEILQKSKYTKYLLADRSNSVYLQDPELIQNFENHYRVFYTKYFKNKNSFSDLLFSSKSDNQSDESSVYDQLLDGEMREKQETKPDTTSEAILDRKENDSQQFKNSSSQSQSMISYSGQGLPVHYILKNDQQSNLKQFCQEMKRELGFIN